jgi:hypothetical protein
VDRLSWMGGLYPGSTLVDQVSAELNFSRVIGLNWVGLDWSSVDSLAYALES